MSPSPDPPVASPPVCDSPGPAPVLPVSEARRRASILRRAASEKLLLEGGFWGSLGSSVAASSSGAASSGATTCCWASTLCRAASSKALGLGGSTGFGGQLIWTSLGGLGGSTVFGGQLIVISSPGLTGAGPCATGGLGGSFFPVAVTLENIPGLCRQASRRGAGLFFDLLDGRPLGLDLGRRRHRDGLAGQRAGLDRLVLLLGIRLFFRRLARALVPAHRGHPGLQCRHGSKESPVQPSVQQLALRTVPVAPAGQAPEAGTAPASERVLPPWAPASLLSSCVPSSPPSRASRPSSVSSAGRRSGSPARQYPVFPAVSIATHVERPPAGSHREEPQSSWHRAGLPGTAPGGNCKYLLPSRRWGNTGTARPYHRC